MLLEEVIHFNSKTGNYDRVIAASLAITMARHLDPIIVVKSLETDPRIKNLYKKDRTTPSLFTEKKQLKRSRLSRLFS